MADFALQRKNMVESQVRPSDITDRRIIRAMLDLPREAFCPPSQAVTAYRDGTLRINDESGPRARYALAPRTLAQLLQALELGERDAVLEIGCGTGYGSAVLSRIAAKVIALEPDAGLAATARKVLEKVGAANVTVIEGDCATGYAVGAPYDAILISGGAEQVPRAILDQLKDGGRLAVVVGDRGCGRLTQWRRLGGNFDARVICDASAPALAAFEMPREFVF